MVELLRLSKAARNDVRVREPIHLRGLLEVGLARVQEDSIVVTERVPAVPDRLVERLPVRLRREHAIAMAGAQLAAADGAGERKAERSKFSNHKTQAHSEAGRTAADQHGRQADRQPPHPR